MKSDKESIISALKLWFRKGDVFEIRVLDAVSTGWMRPHMESGYFDYEHIPDAADAICRLRAYRGAYATVNPVNPDLLARACNRLRGITREATTSDSDILARRWLLIDCDPKRVSGVSSSDAEHEAAITMACKIRAGLAASGWPDPILLDSGNGAQMMYRIDLPVADGDLVQRCIAGIATAGDDKVDVDLTVFNPARIWRIPGTMNCKGDDVPSRPHRMARVLSVPEKRGVVTPEQMEIAASWKDAPPAAETTSLPSDGVQATTSLPREVSEFDLDAWIARFCPELGEPQVWKDGRKWVFPVCPFNDAHRNRSAVLIQHSNGAIAFRCHHNSCTGNDWRKLRELRDPGCYERRESTLPDVDISGILVQKPKTETPPVEEKIEREPVFAPLPEKLLDVPGFVTEYVEYTMRTGQYPNRILSFCSALAFLAFLTGRKIMDERNNRSNIYLVALANSGTGKDHPRKVNMNVAIQNDLGACIAEAFGSGEGLEDAMFLHPSMLFEIDEFDTVFNALKFARDGRGESIMEKLLRFYGASNGVYKMRKLSIRNGDGKKTDDDRKIVNPNLVILGTAIPKFFYSALSERVLANGLIARCMILDAGKRGHGRKPSGESIPEAITRAIEVISKYGQSGNLTEINPEPMLIPASPEADALLTKLNEKYDCIYDRHEAAQRNEAMAFWARVFEKVCKLSMLYAVSENPVNPVVSVAGVKWAAAFVEHITEQMLLMVDAYSFENMFDEKCRKAVRYIREAGGRVAHGVLLKRMHESKEVFKQIIETLEENGTISHEMKGSGVSMTRFYFLR